MGGGFAAAAYLDQLATDLALDASVEQSLADWMMANLSSATPSEAVELLWEAGKLYAEAAWHRAESRAAAAAARAIRATSR